MISVMNLLAHFLGYAQREKGKGYKVRWIASEEGGQALGDCERAHQKAK